MVVRGEHRKYYRFRPAQFYGGTATADCVGCNLSCCYCWSDRPRRIPQQSGAFYSPSAVKDRLVKIARDNHYRLVRLSGNEPTIGREHLISLSREIQETGLQFVLETNGIILGAEISFVEELQDFDNIHVRVSLKGCNRELFSRITGAEPGGFELQIQCLRNLVDYGIECHPAVVADLATRKQMRSLRELLAGVDPELEGRLEVERLIFFPHVVDGLKKAGFEEVL